MLCTRLPHSNLVARLVLASMLLAMAGCQTPLNNLRAKRFGSGGHAVAPTVSPRAMVLGLRASPDGRSLTADSLKAANALLTRHGPLSRQVLSITPLNDRSAEVAVRLAQVLSRQGARQPRVEPLPTDAPRLEQAARSGWDLELQSEALVVDTPRCTIANANDWTIHPHHGVGSLGCANRANIARMTSDPRDVARPADLDDANGQTAAAAVGRYQRGNLRELIDLDFDR